MNLLGPLTDPRYLKGIRFITHVLKERRAINRAAKRMPQPVPWEWARSRIIPLISGPVIDPPDLPRVRAVAGPGCAVEFGMDLGGVYLTVDAIVAERWECSPEQLREVSLANLRRRTSLLSPAKLSTGVFSGRMTRLFRQPGWAASLVLLDDELMRLFGAHDQFIAAPSRSLLLSFPIETPARVVADTIVDLESGEPLPLLFEPFVIRAGRLVWQPPDADFEIEDDQPV